MKRAALLVIPFLLLVSMFTYAVNIGLAAADADLELEMILSNDVFTIGEEINITLTLTNIGDENITITYGPPFFDLFYCTSEGCFRWSDGKAFTLIILDLVLEPGENYTETLQWDLYQYKYPDYYPPQPGAYTLNSVSYWAGVGVSAIVRIFYPVLHIVPDDYSTIQGAINNANEGDTIFARSGTYFEHVVVNKSISLIGEDKNTTIINGSYIGTVLNITAESVEVAGFNIQKSGTVVSPSHCGILVTSNNTIIRNNIVTNNSYGISFLSSSANMLYDNTILNNSYGTCLAYSSNNDIHSNVLSLNENAALSISISSNCNIILNTTIFDNNNGIVLHYESNNNTLTDNTVFNNTKGITLAACSNNTIFHNEFIENDNQVFIPITEYANHWDNGAEGNYWSDYVGTDLNFNGIGDTPYVIDQNNTDHYPLMNPYLGHNIAIENLGISKNIVGEGYTSPIYTNITNSGSFPETFNLTVYANTSSIATFNVSLSHLNYTMLPFSWNTTGFAYGNYTMSAYVEPVFGENATSDNLLVDGWILVTIPGDIDGDKFVNAKDAIALGAAFYPFGVYNPNADINGDGYCNAKDAIILGANFSQNWS